MPRATPTGAIAVGPTKEVTVADCPLLSTADGLVGGAVSSALGMRLGRVSALKNGSTVTGCRIYACQDNAVCASENLPPADQPVVEVTSSRYRSAVLAHNALVLLERKIGHNPQQVSIKTGYTTLCFQTRFYPPDNGQDWACAFAHGDRLVVVKTVVTSPALTALDVTKLVARKL